MVFCLNILMYGIYKVLYIFREATAKARSQETVAQRHHRQEKDRVSTSATRSIETAVEKCLRNRTNRLE